MDCCSTCSMCAILHESAGMVLEFCQARRPFRRCHVLRLCMLFAQVGKFKPASIVDLVGVVIFVPHGLEHPCAIFAIQKWSFLFAAAARIGFNSEAAFLFTDYSATFSACGFLVVLLNFQCFSFVVSCLCAFCLCLSLSTCLSTACCVIGFLACKRVGQKKWHDTTQVGFDCKFTWFVFPASFPMFFNQNQPYVRILVSHQVRTTFIAPDA